eukprot:373788_1
MYLFTHITRYFSKFSILEAITFIFSSIPVSNVATVVSNPLNNTFVSVSISSNAFKSFPNSLEDECNSAQAVRRLTMVDKTLLLLLLLNEELPLPSLRSLVTAVVTFVAVAPLPLPVRKPSKSVSCEYILDILCASDALCPALDILDRALAAASRSAL